MPKEHNFSSKHGGTEEHEFGTRPKSNAVAPLISTTKSPPTSPGKPKSSLQLNDLYNPYKFVIKRFQVPAASIQGALGFRVTKPAHGVIQVTGVSPGSLASQLGIATGGHLLAANGRRALGTPMDTVPDQNGLRLTFVYPRDQPLDPQTFPMPYGLPPRQSGQEYHCIRLKPAEGKFPRIVATAGQDGRVCIGNSQDPKAAAEMNLRIGDKILTVDGNPVKNIDHYNMLIQATQGDPVDLLIERNTAAPKVQQPKQEEVSTHHEVKELSLIGNDEDDGHPKPDPNRSNPAVGVPEAPLDITNMMMRSRALNIFTKNFKRATVIRPPAPPPPPPPPPQPPPPPAAGQNAVGSLTYPVIPGQNPVGSMTIPSVKVTPAPVAPMPNANLSTRVRISRNVQSARLKKSSPK